MPETAGAGIFRHRLEMLLRSINPQVSSLIKFQTAIRFGMFILTMVDTFGLTGFALNGMDMLRIKNLSKLGELFLFDLLFHVLNILPQLYLQVLYL